MVPMSILTKWHPAGQRVHDSTPKFCTHRGNVTYSFYLTWLHTLNLSEPSFAPTEAQGADSGPSPHKQNISLLWHQTLLAKRSHPTFAKPTSAHHTIMSLHPTAAHLTLLPSERFQKLPMSRSRKHSYFCREPWQSTSKQRAWEMGKV